MTTKRYRLTARAQFQGEVRESGYVFTLGEGEAGPRKTVPSDAKEAQIADHIGGAGGMIDVPLYEELTEEHNAEIDRAEAGKIAEADAAAAEAAEKSPAAGEPKSLEDDSAGDLTS
jgi:hypothetical protein